MCVFWAGGVLKYATHFWEERKYIVHRNNRNNDKLMSVADFI